MLCVSYTSLGRVNIVNMIKVVSTPGCITQNDKNQKPKFAFCKRGLYNTVRE